MRLLHETEDEACHKGHEIRLPVLGHISLAGLLIPTFRHAREDALMAFAGNLTYNAFLAVFPFLLFLVSILKLVDATGLITSLVDAIAHSLPAPAAHLVRQQILPDVMSRLTDNPWLSLLLALGSLWQVTFVGRAIVQAMNRMYETEDRRAWWRRFLLPLLFALGAAILFLAALALLVFGPQLGAAIGNGLGSSSAGWWASFILRWPLLLVLAFFAFAVIYYWGPDLDQRAPFVSMGAALATVAWVIFSVGFSLVLNQFAIFLISPLYGWFTGLIILLMYLYWSSVILLVGAEVNRVIEDNTPGSRSPS